MIISNVMSNSAAYNDHARDALMAPMDQSALGEIMAPSARHHVHHGTRCPAHEWPEPVVRSFSHLNKDISVALQGPSQQGASGRLLEAGRTPSLRDITIRVPEMGASCDPMDLTSLRHLASLSSAREYRHCPEGSHPATYDDHETYFEGLNSS